MKKISLAAVSMTLAALSVQAVELPDIISDNAVLQQNTKARLWGWARPGRKVTVTPSWDGKSYTAKADSKTGRWDVNVDTPEASFTPWTVTFDDGESPKTISNVLIGEVWFCSGQSNMEMPLRGFGIQPIEGAGEAIAYSGKYPHIRMANVPKRQEYDKPERVEGKWNVSSPAKAAEFSALAYFFARTGEKTVDPWYRIGVLYNGMLHPLAGYTIKGFLWNQGESNVGLHNEYPSHKKDLVQLWRNEWGNPDLPFYFVEMPPWSYGDPQGDHAARFRECQHKAAAMIPNTGIVCTTDLIYPHELEDVHASQKKPIGERLAFLAAAKTYGVEGIHTQYPTFKSVDYQGDKAVLTFDNAYGGLNPNRDIEGFEVAGEDKVFHPAKAVEDWDKFTITVSSPEVSDIKAVRYCFRNFAPGKLKDMLGLPLVPFRTDNWE